MIANTTDELHVSCYKTPMQQIDQKTYQDEFLANKGSAVPIGTEALRQALDIRKFEIDLYWRRATYFWAFIGAAFAGYGIAQGLKDPIKTDLAVFVGCLGLVFSFAWYCVNRGSKRWQTNWEYHVDNLEDDVIGPLYKTVISGPAPQGLLKRIEAWIVGPGNFSVSKINQIVSAFVTVLWAALVFNALPPFDLKASVNWYYTFLLSTALMAIILMLTLGRTAEKDSKGVAVKRESSLQGGDNAN
jgi:hypothetical protein